MKAVSATTPLPEASVAAVAAGCDVVLLCNSTADEQWAAIESLIRAFESGAIPRKRMDDAWRRQRQVKERFARPGRAPALDCIGSDAHRAVAEEMAAWQ
jgi:beta-N-acetylhexosaminidase